ncbi:MAG: cation:proton antiporter [Jaaginema sp. PMC 1080.18]|nr:cation:proton antiporter [Jaaginema sp. PMC 1080.18]MEC4867592.1 cation:proton antiporter [Jaaginema sp. PMC 1078.18]
MAAAGTEKFIIDLTLVLGTSALGGFLANRLRQPVLLGYLVSGLVIGPFGFKLLSELEDIKALAEVGVAFLLFALGVEFSLAELKRVKEIAIQGSLLQISATIILTAIFSLLFGWVESPTQGIFLGAILSLSSTAVVLKTLTERGETNTIHGQLMLAILIAQDLALGLMLAILPALNDPQNLVPALSFAILKAVLFIAGALAAGYWLVPKVIKTVARTESSELFLLTTIALCLGVALITSALGLSIEMGAFVAGLMIAEIDYSDQALAKVLPLRDTFASLFFASIGMLIDPVVIWNNLGIILGLVLLVMLGKAFIIFPIIIKFGYSFKNATIVALGLNQIGEFSFVLALVAFDTGFITQEKYLLLLGTTAITLVLTPLELRFSPRLVNRLNTIPGLVKYLEKFQRHKELSIPETISNHIVVAGYGRVGQTIVNILRNQGYPVLVIENSEAAIQRLRQEKIPYIFGDGDSELVLEKAHLEKAKALAIALPDPASTRLLLKRALELAPELDVVARSHENSEIDVLTQLGATEVVQPEFEAALEMGAHTLNTLGESKTNIDLVINAIRTDRYLSVRPKRASELLQKDVIDAASAIHNEWVTIPDNSPLNNLTLAKANVRNLTGVTVMAIQSQNGMTYYPKGETELHQGDRLLIVGKRSEAAAFQDLMQGKLSLENTNVHWITLQPESPLVGITPADLQQQYSVIIQALRRQGKLYRPVHDDVVFMVQDSLLLSGERDRIQAIEELAQGETDS